MGLKEIEGMDVMEAIRKQLDSAVFYPDVVYTFRYKKLRVPRKLKKKMKSFIGSGLTAALIKKGYHLPKRVVI